MTEILLGIGFISLLLVALAAVVHKVREYLLPSRPVAVTVSRASSLASSSRAVIFPSSMADGAAEQRPRQ